MVPIIPSVLVNYACATMKIPHKNFILMVAVGMFPTLALYAFGATPCLRETTPAYSSSLF
ncbi:hypothetical protein DBQ14_07120 [Limosilactobacillus fermentum]|nr:hypothetical protein DBQ14_07120 [Limosilactobacillus fermentum]